jgi:DUF1365 family protein
LSHLPDGGGGEGDGEEVDRKKNQNGIECKTNREKQLAKCEYDGYKWNEISFFHARGEEVLFSSVIYTYTGKFVPPLGGGV